MSATAAEPASPDQPTTLGQRVAAMLVAAVTTLVERLPERLVYRVADLVGLAHYLVARRRRALARRNLRRVCRYLAAHGPATSAVLDGTRGGRHLERLVRGVFRHHARYYAEVMLTARFTADYLAERLEIDEPDLATTAFAGDGPGHGAIFVGLHFGAIELPVVFATRLHGRRVVAPMETIANPALQARYLAQRSRVGVRLIDPAGSRAELTEALARGDLVALVADRDLGGSSRPVPFFGAPAMLPVGPALLALQTGVPVWVTGIRRVADGGYVARLLRLDGAAGGAAGVGATGAGADGIETRGGRMPPLRDRVARFMVSQARAYERIVADAPEQWWTLLFPIWTSEAPR